MIPVYGSMPRPKDRAEGLEQLEIHRFPAPRGLQSVTLTSSEWTSVCPRTGQPDFGTIEIRYVPGNYCIESKSLKFYLWSFRDEGAFCESLACQVAEDVMTAISPQSVLVTVSQNSRGGITLVSIAELSRDLILS